MSVTNLFNGPRLSHIIESINNYYVYLENKSPLVSLLEKHIEKSSCEDCTRFLQYYRPVIYISFQGHLIPIKNNYPSRPKYPSCKRGISIFKHFFSNMINLNKELLVLTSPKHHNYPHPYPSTDSISQEPSQEQELEISSIPIMSVADVRKYGT